MAYRFVRTSALVAVCALAPYAFIHCAPAKSGRAAEHPFRPVPSAAPTASLPAVVPAPPRGTGAPRVDTVIDEAFGLELADPYRWMEQPNNAELTQWMAKEGERTRAVLQAIPRREALFQRVLATGLGVASLDRVQVVGDRLFYLKVDKGSTRRALVMRDPDGIEHTLIDPAKIAGSDGTYVSVDHFQASPDGKLVAYGLSQGGGEIATEHVLDCASGRERDAPIEHIWGELSVSWLPDGKGFFYTQMASAPFSDPSLDKLQNMRVLAHTIGERSHRRSPRWRATDHSFRIRRLWGFDVPHVPPVSLALARARRRLGHRPRSRWRRKR